MENYIEYKRHRAIVRKKTRRKRRDDGDKFVKTLERDIRGTQRRGFKIFKQLQLQERDKLKINPITKTERLRWSRGSVLAFSTQVRGFKPGRNFRIFRTKKILGTPSFEGEVKPSVPCRRFAACKRSLNLSGSRNLGKITGQFLAHSSTFRC